MANDNALISIFVTNLSEYVSCSLVGEWLQLPTTRNEYRNLLQRIGNPDELFISDYDIYIDATFGEYENINLLNYLAYKLNELSDYDVSKFNAILELESLSLVDMINICDNLDCYDFYNDIHNDYDLGYYYVEESGLYDTKNMGALVNYIDYERFGHDIFIEELGLYTKDGYICRNYEIEVSYFTSIDDIPADVRL